MYFVLCYILKLTANPPMKQTRFILGKYGWGSRIRTYEIDGSEPPALPLGYTPIFINAIIILAYLLFFVELLYRYYLLLINSFIYI